MEKTKEQKEKLAALKAAFEKECISIESFDDETQTTRRVSIIPITETQDLIITCFYDRYGTFLSSSSTVAFPKVK